MRPAPMFSRIKTGINVYDNVDKASYKGITLKTVFFFVLTMIAAITSYVALFYIVIESTKTGELDKARLSGLIVATIICIIVAAVFGLIGSFFPSTAKVCGIVYSLAEGFALGVLSALVEVAFKMANDSGTNSYPAAGVVPTALFGTLIIFAVVLVLFATGVIKADRKLRACFFAILLSVLAISLFTIIMYLTGVINNRSYLMILLGIEALYIIYASIMLVFTFAEAQMIVKSGADKKAEWSVAFGLIFCLIYIYIELLRIAIIILELTNRGK